MKRLCACAVLAGAVVFSPSVYAMPQGPPTPPPGATPGVATGPAGLSRAQQPPGKVTGRVLRVDTGRPLPKASVLLTPEGRFTDQMMVRVDANGVFEFAEVPPGRYRMTAQRNGYVTQTYGQRGGGPGVIVEVQSRQVVDKIQFSLERGGVITGNVLDEDNEPVENVEVRAQRVRFTPGGKQRATSVKTARTDDLGGYRLTNLSPGLYYVQAGGRGESVSVNTVRVPFSYAATYYPAGATREEAQRVQVTAGGETRRIDFSLRPGNTFVVSGIVIDSSPPTGPVSYSVGTMTASASAASGLAPGENRFTLHNLEPGDHQLFASASSSGGERRQGYRKVTITDSNQQVIIEIGKTASISGEVKLDGKESATVNLARVFVRLQGEDEGAPSGGSQIHDNRFEMKAVSEGSYTFAIGDPSTSSYLKEARCGGEDYTTRKLQVTSETKIEDCIVTLAADVAQATVTVDRDGKPGEGSVVVFIVADEEKRKNPRYTVLGQTAANGTAQVRGIVPGDYIVYAMMPSDDAIYYDPEFVARNRDTGTKVTVRPSDQHTMSLKVITPK